MKELSAGSRAMISTREKIGMDRDELARLMGVTHYQITKWETGERSPSSAVVAFVKLIGQVAEAYPQLLAQAIRDSDPIRSRRQSNSIRKPKGPVINPYTGKAIDESRTMPKMKTGGERPKDTIKATIHDGVDNSHLPYDRDRDFDVGIGD